MLKCLLHDKLHIYGEIVNIWNLTFAHFVDEKLYPLKGTCIDISDQNNNNMVCVSCQNRKVPVFSRWYYCMCKMVIFNEIFYICQDGSNFADCHFQNLYHLLSLVHLVESVNLRFFTFYQRLYNIYYSYRFPLFFFLNLWMWCPFYASVVRRVKFITKAKKIDISKL